MSPGIILLLITVATALVFDFLNGFHDAANSIATVVSTRVLSPKLAVIWAAAFNFLAAFLLGTAVAKTIGARHDSGVHRHPVRGAGWAGGRDRVGCGDVAAGTADLVVARADRRLRRGSDGEGDDPARLESGAPASSCPAAGTRR